MKIYLINKNVYIENFVYIVFFYVLDFSNILYYITNFILYIYTVI